MQEYLRYRTLHRKNIIDSGVFHVAQTSNRAATTKVNLAIHQKWLVNVDSNNMPNDDNISMVWFITRQINGLKVPALHVDGTIFYARRLD